MFPGDTAPLRHADWQPETLLSKELDHRRCFLSLLSNVYPYTPPHVRHMGSRMLAGGASSVLGIDGGNL